MIPLPSPSHSPESGSRRVRLEEAALTARVRLARVVAAVFPDPGERPPHVIVLRSAQIGTGAALAVCLHAGLGPWLPEDQAWVSDATAVGLATVPVLLGWTGEHRAWAGMSAASCACAIVAGIGVDLVHAVPWLFAGIASGLGWLAVRRAEALHARWCRDRHLHRAANDILQAHEAELSSDRRNPTRPS